MGRFTSRCVISPRPERARIAADMHRIVAVLSRAVGGAYRADLQAYRRTRGHAVVSAKVFWPWNAAVYRPVQSPDGEPSRVGRFWRIDAVEGHPRPAGSRRRGDLGELLPVRGRRP